MHITRVRTKDGKGHEGVVLDIHKTLTEDNPYIKLVGDQSYKIDLFEIESAITENERTGLNKIEDIDELPTWLKFYRTNRFFEKVDGILNKEKEFAVMYYKNPERNLLKILLDRNSQFTSEFTVTNWKEIELLYNDLFTKDRVVGTISIKEIIHDAAPDNKGLNKFFKPNKKSLYKEPPLGLNGGKAKFTYHDGNKVGLVIEDLSYTNNLSGKYEMLFTDSLKLDGKDRMSTIVKFYKV